MRFTILNTQTNSTRHHIQLQLHTKHQEPPHELLCLRTTRTMLAKKNRKGEIKLSYKNQNQNITEIKAAGVCMLMRSRSIMCCWSASTPASDNSTKHVFFYVYIRTYDAMCVRLHIWGSLFYSLRFHSSPVCSICTFRKQSHAHKHRQLSLVVVAAQTLNGTIISHILCVLYLIPFNK